MVIRLQSNIRHTIQNSNPVAKEPASVLHRSSDVDFICRDSERQQCIHQQPDTRSHPSHCTKAPQPKARRPKERVSKKSTATQQARHEAMAARSLKKKWDLRKAVLASMGNAIKQLSSYPTQREAVFPSDASLCML